MTSLPVNKQIYFYLFYFIISDNNIFCAIQISVSIDYVIIAVEQGGCDRLLMSYLYKKRKIALEGYVKKNKNTNNEKTREERKAER